MPPSLQPNVGGQYLNHLGMMLLIGDIVNWQSTECDETLAIDFKDVSASPKIQDQCFEVAHEKLAGTPRLLSYLFHIYSYRH